MFNENLVITDLDAKNQREVLTILTNKLRQYDLVKDTFLKAILKREAKYPTGLHTETIDVAIPHTDKIYVNSPSIAVATLTHPVNWEQMGSPGVIDHPILVIMLAIKDPKKQLSLLANLMVLLQNHIELKRIAETKDKKEIVKILNSYLDAKKGEKS